jgi:hypothetical protein
VAADSPDRFGEELDDDRRLVLGDLINRVLDKGVVIAGDVMISVADIDLIRVDLRVLITAVESELRRETRKATSRRHAAERGGVGDADLPVLPPRSGE